MRTGWFQFNRNVTEGYRRLMLSAITEFRGLDQNLHMQRTVPDSWPDNVTIRMEGEGVEDIPFQMPGWIFMSDRLKKLVEDDGLKGIAFYPVDTVSELSMPIPTYWYGHFQHLEGAIDFANSFYRDGEIKGKPFLIMVKFAFKGSAIDGHDFFRPAEYPAAAFCSSRFRDLFLKNNCTGMGFTPVRVS